MKSPRRISRKSSRRKPRRSSRKSIRKNNQCNCKNCKSTCILRMVAWFAYVFHAIEEDDLAMMITDTLEECRDLSAELIPTVERYRKDNKENHKKYREENKEEITIKKEEYRLKSKYGITLTEKNVLLYQRQD